MTGAAKVAPAIPNKGKAMRYALFSLPFIAALTACGPTVQPPRLESDNVVMLQRERELVFKGLTGATNYPPTVNRVVYNIACINDNTGGTPSQRADRSIEAAKRLSPTIRDTMNTNWLRREEREKVNPVIVPQHNCMVMYVDLGDVIARGEAAALAAVIRLGATHELAAHARRR